MNKQSNWLIIKRSFKALKYPKGSPTRYKLNKSSYTSEFGLSKKWLVVNQDLKPLKSFESIIQCKDFIANPIKYKPKHKVYKYTPSNFKLGAKWSYIRKHRFI